MVRNTLLLASSFILVACSSGQLSIHSSPMEADVKVRAIGTTAWVDIGKSPIRIASSAIREKVKSDSPVELKVQKEGYVPENIMLLDYYDKNLLLEMRLETEQEVREAKKIDQIVGGLFECHRLIKAKKFLEAQARVVKLLERYPQVSTLHEFQGSIYYILQEKMKAFDSFTLAAKYNEENVEAKRMLGILKQELSQN